MAVVDDYRALLSDFYWYPGTPAGRAVVLTYSFPTQVPAASLAQYPAMAPSYQPFGETEKAMARDALRQWSEISGIEFIETTQTDGDLTFGYYDMALSPYPGAAGFASYPSSGAFVQVGGGYGIYSGDLGYAGDVSISDRYLLGSLPLSDLAHVLLHEVGHALGLKHPFEGTDTLNPAFDSGAHTVMSYNSPRSSTLGPLDIDAIRWIYGAADSAYQPFTWTWDAANETATFLIVGDDQYIRGTGAHDVIQANGARDVIVGGGGNDVIHAAGANVEINAGDGNDIVHAAAQALRYYGGDGTDTIETGLVYASLPQGVTVADATWRVVWTGSVFQNYGDVERIGFLDGVYDVATSTFQTTTGAYLSIAATQADRQEGNAGTTPFTFTVSRTNASGGTASVDWAVAGEGTNPATASDFDGGLPPSGTVHFVGGELSRVVTLAVTADTTVEPDERFRVTLSNPSDGNQISTGSAVGVIRNDDATLSIAASASAVEGASGTTFISFTVTRDGARDGTVIAAWNVTGSGANPASASDFAGGTLPSGTVIVGPGQTTGVISVIVAGDQTAEPDEDFTVTLSSITGATAGTTTATGTILDDDNPIHQTVFATDDDDVFDLGDGIDTVVFAGDRADYRIGIAGNIIRVLGPSGDDQLKNVEQLQFGASPPITTETLFGQDATDGLMSFITDGRLSFEFPIPYSGPLDLAYVYPGTSRDDIVAGTDRNDFMNLAGGNDAVHMGDGDDIVDGGGGSNFLSGDAGRDTFFLDGRFGVPVWSAITDWEPGEVLTLWGWTPGVSKAAWAEDDGLPGYTGATMFGDLDGNGLVETAVTWTGVRIADLPSSREMEVSGIGVLYFG